MVAANRATVAADEAALLTKISADYDLVTGYTPPKVPLWSDATGLSTRTRQQTQLAVAEVVTSGYFVAAVLFLLNLALVYR